MSPKNPIRVAIVGVGNCASSLVQGVEYYKDARDDQNVPGLMHVRFGKYHVSDIEFVMAFDVDAAKVGLDLSEAINASENNTIKICDVPLTNVTVLRGPTLDGLGHYYRELIQESSAPTVDVVASLISAKVDVLVCYLPVGSENAARFYAQAAIDAGVAFVNALPVFIASEPEWAKKFQAAGIPIIGDDIKSQIGATITHRALVHLFEKRGVTLDRTYQLNVGGNMDFKNMLERDRLESKKISKTQAVTSNTSVKLPKRDIHVGPSDYVPWLDDRKFAFVRLEGRNFGDVPVSIEYKLEVWDSPNSAGVVIDAVRAAKIGLDRGIGGPLIAASSYFMKSPPEQFPDEVAHDKVEAFIRDNLIVTAEKAPALGIDLGTTNSCLGVFQHGKVDRPPTRNALEGYCFSIKQALDDDKLKDKIDASDRATITAKIEEMQKWMDANSLSEKEEFEHKRRELEKIFNPIISKVYQGAGGAPTYVEGCFPGAGGQG